VRVFYSFVALTGLGVKAGPLPTDPPVYRRLARLESDFVSKITATVEYSVYAPGQFDIQQALGFPRSEPWTLICHAYEVFQHVPFKDLTIATLAARFQMLTPARIERDGRDYTDLRDLRQTASSTLRIRRYVNIHQSAGRLPTRLRKVEMTAFGLERFDLVPA